MIVGTIPSHLPFLSALYLRGIHHVHVQQVNEISARKHANHHPEWGDEAVWRGSDKENPRNDESDEKCPENPKFCRTHAAF